MVKDIEEFILVIESMNRDFIQNVQQKVKSCLGRRRVTKLAGWAVHGRRNAGVTMVVVGKDRRARSDAPYLAATFHQAFGIDFPA